MSTAAFASTISRFDRTLSAHLATHVLAGIRCDESVVRQCYVQTRQDLKLSARPANDPCAEQIESLLIANVATLIQSHQRFLAVMPPPVASTFIAELFFDKPW